MSRSNKVTSTGKIFNFSRYRRILYPFVYFSDLTLSLCPVIQLLLWRIGLFDYIHRNFPEVDLFPDITKLSDTDSNGNPKAVVDVYGREQPIPLGNLFIAGTSCKDFSMLKTTLRKDIEDKGQSGQTFLAAVEFLDLYKPVSVLGDFVHIREYESHFILTCFLKSNLRNANKPFAIFENVDGAVSQRSIAIYLVTIKFRNSSSNFLLLRSLYKYSLGQRCRTTLKEELTWQRGMMTKPSHRRRKRVSLTMRFEPSNHTVHFTHLFPCLLLRVDADVGLVFSVNSDCQYEATKIPAQVGMKAGDRVEGFIRKGAKSSDVTSIKADPGMIGKEINLEQLAKTHKINLDADTLVLEKMARYCTHLVKLDTKSYGLPQTRNRKVSLSSCLSFTINDA